VPLDVGARALDRVALVVGEAFVDQAAQPLQRLGDDVGEALGERREELREVGAGAVVQSPAM
jgi:hypothetical protein